MIHTSPVEEGVTACMHKRDSLLRPHRGPRATSNAECKSRKPRASFSALCFSTLPLSTSKSSETTKGVKCLVEKREMQFCKFISSE